MGKAPLREPKYHYFSSLVSWVARAAGYFSALFCRFEFPKVELGTGTMLIRGGERWQS